jgi:hypothetical protein
MGFAFAFPIYFAFVKEWIKDSISKLHVQVKVVTDKGANTHFSAGPTNPPAQSV